MYNVYFFLKKDKGKINFRDNDSIYHFNMLIFKISLY
jgi:hypothetical protein